MRLEKLGGFDPSGSGAHRYRTAKKTGGAHCGEAASVLAKAPPDSTSAARHVRVLGVTMELGL